MKYYGGGINGTSAVVLWCRCDSCGDVTSSSSNEVHLKMMGGAAGITQWHDGAGTMTADI